MNIISRIWQAVTNNSEQAPLTIKASSTSGYDAGGFGRRAMGWNASRLGPNTLLWANLEQMRARARDAVRNSPVARAAIDRWEANCIGTGIVPHFLYPDTEVRLRIQAAWDRWVRQADYAGPLGFYQQQALVARELFEVGECFARFHVRPDSDKLYIPLQIQLIEAEQCPIFRNAISDRQNYPTNVSIKSGIVFDQDDHRIGYDMYSAQPYDVMFGGALNFEFVFVPVEDMLHIMKPLRAGQLRGEPQMTAVLALLYDIESYSDAERVRKKAASMFAGIVTTPVSEDQPFPQSAPPVLADPADPLNQSVYAPGYDDPGSQLSKMEPGTIQRLFPGETIEFPQLPTSGDYDRFMYTELHRFAAGVGLTYEQLTGDLKGVNYSSIRAGLLEFRRSCEQYQHNIITNGFCDPVMRRWMNEAVLSGALELPGDYVQNPEPYQAVAWVPPGWSWVDPQREMAAYQQAVRSGFTSRTMVVRETGYDPAVVDAQQAEERKRAAELGLIYDSDPNKVLIGRESQPLTPTSAAPDQAAAQEQGDDSDTGNDAE